MPGPDRASFSIMKKFLFLVIALAAIFCQTLKAQNIVYSIPYTTHSTTSFGEIDEEYDWEEWTEETPVNAALLLFDDGSIMIVVQFKDKEKNFSLSHPVTECYRLSGMAFAGKPDKDGNEAWISLDNEGRLQYFIDRSDFSSAFSLYGDSNVTLEKLNGICNDFNTLSGAFFSHFVFYDRSKAQLK